MAQLTSQNYLNMNMGQAPSTNPTSIAPQIDNTPYGGMPNYPGYHQGWDPSMATSGGMSQALGGVQPDYQAVDAFKGQAMRTGPSAWAGLANQNQNLLTAQAKDGAAEQSASQVASARDASAMRGGLTGGASQQLGMQGQKNYLNMSQDIGRQDQLNKMQIGMNDETNRIQQMGMLPGMEAQTDNVAMQKAGLQQGANQFDVGAQMGEAGMQNGFELGKFNTAVQGWGAGKQAQGMENSGK